VHPSSTGTASTDPNPETAMNATPALPRRSFHAVTIPTILAAVIGSGLIAGVTGLFQHDGSPFERLVAAAPTCAHYAYVSERERCVSTYLAVTRQQTLASR
jgi:hypothetical protein